MAYSETPANAGWHGNPSGWAAVPRLGAVEWHEMRATDVSHTGNATRLRRERTRYPPYTCVAGVVASAGRWAVSLAGPAATAQLISNSWPRLYGVEKVLGRATLRLRRQRQR